MSVELVRRALERRGPLLERLAEEGTDCYRLFHGVAEGRPGLAIDRYGPVLLLQSWREDLTEAEIACYRAAVEGALDAVLVPVWNRRGRRAHAPGRAAETVPRDPIGRELGLAYDVTPRHRGQDPLLFLDLRSGRRMVLARSRGTSVLNLFGYTGGVTLCAVAGGASEVWHVDFSRSATGWARRNLELNGIDPRRVTFVREDVIPVVRQLAGLPVKGRGARARAFARFEPRRFGLVVLDPPRFAKSAFGAVDVVRDYPSLLKPALLATEPGGALLVSNNASEVSRDAWLAVLNRTAEKCGRPIDSIALVEPEEDFPSFDDAPPLKLAWMSVA